MRNLAKRAVTLALSLVFVLSMTIMTFAADGDVTKTVDGLKVTVHTDSEEYAEGEAVKFTLTYENQNNYDLENINANFVPDNSIEYDKLEWQKNKLVASLKAGETATVSFTTKGEAHSEGVDNTVIIAVAAGAAVVVILIIILLVLKSKKKKNIAASMMAGILLAGSLAGFSGEAQAAVTNSNYGRVGVHDPSIVKDTESGTYYVFGSHLAFAKSQDLMKWSMVNTNVNSNSEELFGDIWNNYCITDENNKLAGNMWAPDVIWNETMGKWCMYMSINGDDWHSAIVLLTADNIEGPYEYVDEVVFSGYDGSAAGDIKSSNMILNKKITYGEKTDANLKFTIQYQEATEVKTREEIADIRQVLGLKDDEALPSRYNNTDQAKINCIDPNVEYDENGDLWLTYGSWSAGIFQIKLDLETGLRDYDYKEYGDYVKDKVDPYLGYKIAGGYYNSGEAPYIVKTDKYYYLFVSLGNLEASGGYNMRIFRSESINGPYVDMDGNSPIYTAWDPTAGFVDVAKDTKTTKYNSKRGIRAMSSVRMYGKSDTSVEVAQGHNSAFVDEDGKIFLVYHSRFSNKGEGFEVRVHQMYINEDGWLVVSPYEYSGETLSTTPYAAAEIAGTYDFSIQYRDKVFVAKSTDSTKGIYDAVSVTLSADGKITGDATGTWKLTKGNNVEMVIDGTTYKGVFVKQANELATRDESLTFTLCGGNQLAWGAKVAK